jgi:hypothetical protein
MKEGNLSDIHKKQEIVCHANVPEKSTTVAQQCRPSNAQLNVHSVL